MRGRWRGVEVCWRGAAADDAMGVRTSSMKRTPGTISALPSSRQSATF